MHEKISKNVEIKQEVCENYAPTLRWSLKLFLGGCLFIDAWENSIYKWGLFIDVCASSIYRSHVYL